MTFKKIALVAAISAFTLPTVSYAAEASLMGWGSAFANAYAQGQQAAAQGSGNAEFKVSFVRAPAAPAPTSDAKPAPAPEAKPAPAPTADSTPAKTDSPSTPDSAKTEQGTKQASDAGQDSAKQASASAAANLTASLELNGDGMNAAAAKLDQAYQTGGAMVEGVTNKVLGAAQGLADQMGGMNLAANAAGSGSLDVAGLANLNAAGNLSTTASLMSAGQLSALTAVTSSVIQNVVASRPTSLVGLLR
ncbi:hypothetical protein NQT62_03585 [Limnobacter humi]|uniref:Secreted protein n=1 Tax=Limnobacter humi TaxID=1778671 RepID=A0ABT1WFJ5_9BURK|nr:hypothetical protein [Limnobacter humi]MCQ8895522.1 hypothetical protein [Limnobacter humi]